MKTILLVIKDRDHNDNIVHFVSCENESTARRVQHKFNKDPKYPSPRYYSEIVRISQVMENDLVDDYGFLKQEYLYNPKEF